MPPEERRAYSRGYNAGSRRAWPEHRPPHPPVEIVARLMTALTALRDGVDGELALFDPEDEIEKHLGPLVDEADAAMSAVSEWLKETTSG